MRYMLDTNICIHVINQKPAKVIQRFKKEKIGNVAISSITLSELKFGAYNSSKPLQNLKAILKFTAPLEVLPFGEAETEPYGKIRYNLKKSGKIIGPMDTLIAAHALSASCVLVTNNVKEFKNVPGLRIENWV